MGNPKKIFILFVSDEQKDKLQKEANKQFASIPAIIRQIMNKYKDTEKGYTGFHTDLKNQIGVYCDIELYQRYRQKYGKNLQSVIRTLIDIEY